MIQHLLIISSSKIAQNTVDISQEGCKELEVWWRFKKTSGEVRKVARRSELLATSILSSKLHFGGILVKKWMKQETDEREITVVSIKAGVFQWYQHVQNISKKGTKSKTLHVQDETNLFHRSVIAWSRKYDHYLFQKAIGKLRKTLRSSSQATTLLSERQFMSVSCMVFITLPSELRHFDDLIKKD